MNPVIEAKNIKFAYNREEVIKDISFALAPQEFLGIIGPNGAGKSTILRIIVRILKSQGGDILIFGEDIRKITPRHLARQIGFVPQETHFALNFSVEEIVVMGRYPYLGTFERERKEDLAAIERAIQAAHIQGLRKRPINSLSSGERQLVVIARALAQEPRILLLDEPTSHLDLHHQSMIMNLLKKLNDQGIAIIIINHDLNLAGLYCERLILINRGRILAEGPPQALFNKDILKQAFGVDVELITHPQKDIPQILLK